MSIFTYTDLPEPQPEDVAVTAVAVNHSGRCGHKDGWPDTSMTELPPECVAGGCKIGYSHESYRGKVVSLRERNGYDDSDFYALVWDRTTGERREVCYASTRGWTYFNNAVVDLSEDDRAEFDRQTAERAEEARKDYQNREVAAAAKLPRVGNKVRVVSKRTKVEHGSEGEVFWFGRSAYARADRYRPSWVGVLYTPSEEQLSQLRNFRVGIRFIDGSKAFCAATAVEVILDSRNETKS